MNDSPDMLPPEQPQPVTPPPALDNRAQPVTGVDPEADKPFNYLALLREVVETALMAAIIWLAINLLIPPFEVDGPSMQPNIVAGERLLVNRPAYFFGEPARGDVVVFNSPEAEDETLIKRVIGLPGDIVAVQDNQVYVNNQRLGEPYLPNGVITWGDQEWTVPAGTYFVLGDNRLSSRDSRSWGPLNAENILGKAWVIYWPPRSWGIAPHARQFSQDYPVADIPLGEALPTDTLPDVEAIEASPEHETLSAEPPSTSTPPSTARPATAAEPVEPITGLIRINTFMLAAPDFAARQVQQLYADESTVIMMGKDTTGNWLYVLKPDSAIEIEGWVWRDTVDISEDAVQQLPVVE